MFAMASSSDTGTSADACHGVGEALGLKRVLIDRRKVDHLGRLRGEARPVVDEDAACGDPAAR